jgi:hypothetical protein
MSRFLTPRGSQARLQAGDARSQQVLFAPEVGIERRTPDPSAIENVLHSDPFEPAIEHQLPKSIQCKLARPGYAAIGFLG